MESTHKRRIGEAVVIGLALSIAVNYWWTAKLNKESQRGGLPSIEGEQIAAFTGQSPAQGVGCHVSYPNFPYYPFAPGTSKSNWADGGRSVVTNSTGLWAA